MNVHTLDELKQLQAMPLQVKVAMTQTRIRAWVNEFGVDGVYVSFSGGKDSTVLLHIVRELYPDIPAVFIDTGLEYPEIREFVKTFDNVTWLKPKMNFKQVIEKFGYPFITKEVSQKVYEAWDNRTGVVYKSFIPEEEGGRRKPYNLSHYRYLFDAPFKLSNRCCNVMKKAPAKEYERRTGRKAIVGSMADESKARQQKWLQYGCNAFEIDRPRSMPMAFWTEQDVLHFIKDNNIDLASVYGDIIKDYGREVVGQLDIFDFGIGEDVWPLKTSGCDRTGCMWCGYGCHIEQEPRFVRMKQTHPKQYDYIMRPKEKGGLNYKEVIDWLNEHGNLHIRY